MHIPQECVLAELSSDGIYSILNVDFFFENAEYLSSIPADSRLFIDATHGTSFMRLDCGSFSSYRDLSEVKLTELESPESAVICVKIVHLGKLLAKSTKWTLNSMQPNTANKRRLIDFSTEDLQEVPWVLRLNDGLPRPLLVFNTKWVDLWNKKGKNIVDDPLVQASILPEVLRRILVRIIIAEKGDWNELFDGFGWRSLWLRLAMKHCGEIQPPEDAEVDRLEEWINLSIAGFCKHKQITSTLGRSLN